MKLHNSSIENSQHQSTHQVQFGHNYPYANSLPADCFGFSRVSTQTRTITTGRPDFGLPDNRVRTAKYNALNFIPLNLIQQFKNPINIYVLIDGALTMVPIISTSSNIPTVWFLLLIVLVLNMVKDYLEDLQCRNRDTRENGSLARVLKGQAAIETQWSELMVGDLIQVHEDEPLPADILLVACCEGHAALVDTRNLDGQTNFKSKYSSKIELPSILQYQGPSNQIYKFSGRAQSQGGEKSVLGIKNVLLRGTVLKGQKWVRGVVLYSGLQTRVMMNNEGTGIKISRMEQFSRGIVISLIVFAAVLGLTGASVSTAGLSTDWMFPQETSLKYFVVKLLTNLILVDNLMSLTVIIGMEICRKYFCYSISWDKPMGTSRANNSKVVQNLGQVRFILSDKTGTLTKNKMRFRQVHSKAVYYGKESQAPSEFVNFYDPAFLPAQHRSSLLCLALCHEAQVRKGQFFSSSAEELCFLNFAGQQGFKFLGREQQSKNTIYEVQVNTAGKKELIRSKVLELFPFQFSRKRQTIVVQIDNQILLVTKGADSTIVPLMKKWDCPAVDQFSKSGLRTMIFASKRLERLKYLEWSNRLRQASGKAQVDEQEVFRLKEQIQKGLELECVVAIQDQLQEELTETITAISEADIGFWIATGDRAEPVKFLLIASGQDLSSFLDYRKGMQMPEGKYKFMVEGADIESFIEDDSIVRAVKQGTAGTTIFYRCTPLQKAKIAHFLKENGGCVLCVGDGDNDVSMIKEADVGVGVRGVEGSQACGVADLVVDQFRLLRRLMFVHGREAHRRMYSLIFIMQFKNVWMALIEFYFGSLNKFSGSPFLEAWCKMFYNIVLTLPPFFHLIAYDYESPPEVLFANKRAQYSLGRANIQRIPSQLLYWWLLSLLTPASSFYLLSWLSENALGSDGRYPIQFETAMAAMIALTCYSNYKTVFQLCSRVSVAAVCQILIGLALLVGIYAILTVFSVSYVYLYGYLASFGWVYLQAGMLMLVLIGTDVTLRRVLQVLGFLLSKCCLQNDNE